MVLIRTVVRGGSQVHWRMPVAPRFLVPVPGAVHVSLPCVTVIGCWLPVFGRPVAGGLLG
jgi:hypothetical protein